MDINLLMKLISGLALIIYLSQLSEKRLNNFGNFIKKVLSVLPITKAIEALTKNKKQ
jgi:hypothetical protein